MNILVNSNTEKGQPEVSRNLPRYTDAGIPTRGVLFDRIIANKLSNWFGVHDEQKLFTIRVLIDTARITNKRYWIF